MGEIPIQQRSPDSSQYIAEVRKDKYTFEFRFGFYLDRVHDQVFDHILSTFKFIEPQATSSVAVTLDKNVYQNDGKRGDQVNVTLRNDSGKTIYYWNGCGINLPWIMKKEGELWKTIGYSQIVCEAEPYIEEWPAGISKVFAWNQTEYYEESRNIQKVRLVNSGIYKAQMVLFSIKPEKRDASEGRFIVESHPFTIVSSPRSATINVLLPSTAERWFSSTKLTIRWSEAESSKITIYLVAKRDLNVVPEPVSMTVANNITNNGSYEWFIPNRPWVNNPYMIKIEEIGGNKVGYSQPFEIIQSSPIPSL